MGLWQGKSKRKISGGKLRRSRKKRKFEIGAEAQITTIGEERKKFARTRSGNQKIRVLSTDKVNIVIPKKNQVKTSKIISVLENPSNPHFVQRNIITKGAIIQTEIGKARVTSRPGQDGIINAILISE
ncbi:MAG: 30S ribosomal protein S8e [Thermoplasmata archaeon]